MGKRTEKENNRGKNKGFGGDSLGKQYLTALIITIIVVIVLALGLFIGAFAMTMKDQVQSGAMLVTGQLDKYDPAHPEGEGENGDAVDIAGDDYLAKAKLVYNYLLDHPDAEAGLSTQLPDGISYTLNNNWSVKNILEVYIIVAEAVQNPVLNPSGNIHMRMLLGTFGQENGWGNGYAYGPDFSFFTDGDFSNDGSRYATPMGTDRGLYGTTDQAYFVTDYENPDLDDTERAGNYGSYDTSNFRSYADVRSSGAYNGFLSDQIAYVCQLWSPTATSCEDKVDAIVQHYNLDDTTREALFDYAVDTRHRGAAYKLIRFSSASINTDGSLKDPGETVGLSLFLEAFNDGIPFEEKYQGHDKSTLIFDAIFDMADEAMAQNSLGFNVNWHGMYNLYCHQLYNWTGTRDAFRNLSKPKDAGWGNFEIHTSALTRYMLGSYAEKEFETLIDIWIADLGLQLSTDNSGPATIDEWIQLIQDIKVLIARTGVAYGSNKTHITYNGTDMEVRGDCSGYVSACLRAYGSLNADLDSGGIADLGNLDGFTKITWSDAGGWDGLQQGDIIAKHGHTEIFWSKEGGTIYVLSNGGPAGVRSEGPTHHGTGEAYETVWRPIPKGGTGGSQGQQIAGLNYLDGGWAVPIIYQGDYSAYQYGPTSRDTIANNGCGPCAMAMALTYYLGREVTPIEIAEWGNANNTSTSRGSNHDFPEKCFAQFTGKPASDVIIKYTFADVEQYLQQGRVVVALQHGGYFTSGGHFITFRGVDDDGKYMVNDSNRANLDRYHGKHWTAEEISQGDYMYWVFP